MALSAGAPALSRRGNMAGAYRLEGLRRDAAEERSGPPSSLEGHSERKEGEVSYRNYLEGLQLRHFSADELIAQGDRTRNGVSNSLPPESIWPAMVRTLWVADMARSALGFPITITSAFRNEAYNLQVGGASRSALSLIHI